MMRAYDGDHDESHQNKAIAYQKLLEGNKTWIFEQEFTLEQQDSQTGVETVRFGYAIGCDTIVDGITCKKINNTFRSYDNYDLLFYIPETYTVLEFGACTYVLFDGRLFCQLDFNNSSLIFE